MKRLFGSRQWEYCGKFSLFSLHLSILYVFQMYSCFTQNMFVIQEEDFQEMIYASQMMENQYGHLFEKVIVNDDLTTAFSQLRQALRKVETEAHWVPISWTHS